MIGHYLRVGPATIAAIRARPAMLVDVLYPNPEPDERAARSLDIGKTWHIIHFLLNGEAWEGTGAAFGAVLGGNALTDEDLGYGPARFLEPLEVAATAEVLARVSSDELWSRFDEARAEEAQRYWSNEPDSKQYALENYDALREFFREAAARSEAVILWLG
jgi:hypothetical protein